MVDQQEDTTIGWDESILEKNKPKKDANDYSRFDDIKDDTDSEVIIDEKFSECKNCSKSSGKLKCSICKKANYCNRDCQKEDWKYHKRICKKPEIKKKTTEKTPKPRKGVSDVVRVTDDEDLVKGYTKEGLPYFHRTLDENEKNLIGDIAPKKIDHVPAVKTIQEQQISHHEGSAWNSCGTFEERDFSKWAKTKLETLLEIITVTQAGVEVQVTKAENMQGDASVCVVRGTKRYIFDFSFQLKWTATFPDAKTYSGKLSCTDVCNDGDHEIACQYTSTKMHTDTMSQLKGMVHTKESILQQEVVRKIQEFQKEYQSL